jgi:hypothetical protein
MIITGKQIRDLMSQENVSGNMPPRKPAAPATAKGDEAAASLAYETSSGITINFHSAEFNRMDDLNDCAGNYRNFQPLDGVVTADMRHQMERLRMRDAVDFAADDTVSPKKAARERNEAETPDAAPPLTVISRGRTLIVDTDAERSIACGKLLSDRGLTCTVLVTNKAASAAYSPRFDQFSILEVDAVSITGAFGSFAAMVTANGNQRPLSEWFGSSIHALFCGRSRADGILRTRYKSRNAPGGDGGAAGNARPVSSTAIYGFSEKPLSPWPVAHP